MNVVEDEEVGFQEMLDECLLFYGTYNSIIKMISESPLPVNTLASDNEIVTLLQKQYNNIGEYMNNPNRQRGTQFEINYNNQNIGANPNNSVLLYINMHGEIPIKPPSPGRTPEPTYITSKGVSINKYSTSVAGQCSVSTPIIDRFMIYALKNALDMNKPLDVNTIFREALLYRPNILPQQIHQTQNSQSVKQYAANFALSQNQNQHLDGARSSFGELFYDVNNPSGELVTFGNRYVEKMFLLGDDDPNTIVGIYLCNDFPQIEGKKTDNLLANDAFRMFMYEKHGETKLDNLKPQITLKGEQIVAVDFVKTSDIIEFCKQYGRPHISIVDNSCTVLSAQPTRSIGMRTTEKVVRNINKNKSIVGGINKKTSRKTKNNKKRRKTKRRKY
jgi:hypothetical protein